MLQHLPICPEALEPEIDKAHRAALCFNFCFKDKRVPMIAATRFRNLLSKEPPMSVSTITEKRRKTRVRIKPRKTKPIDTAVVTHERTGLRVAEKRVAVDPCPAPSHFTLAQ